MAAEMVDHLVARDGEQPGGEGAVTIIGGTARMHRNQRFLHQILDIVVAAGSTPIEAAQQGHEQAQQCRVIAGIAVEPADHQSAQFCLACPHSRSLGKNSRRPRDWLQHRGR